MTKYFFHITKCDVHKFNWDARTIRIIRVPDFFLSSDPFILEKNFEKHIENIPQFFFSKTQNFVFFQKRGSDAKQIKNLKKNLKRASKTHIKHMQHS